MHVMHPIEERREQRLLVRIPAGQVVLEGTLALPEGATGLVLFAHGSGSSRHSPRNRFVAQSLRMSARVGTLLFDLLSHEEDQLDARTGRYRFDVGLLATRLVAATDWTAGAAETRTLPKGYFGASTGAAAALIAAAERPDAIRAVVSRGGRPDLAGSWLPKVQANTLLLVGGEDYLVLDLNREARARMLARAGDARTRGADRSAVHAPDVVLEVIPGATHLFEEPGALESVARRASAWFARYLRSPEAR
jgi:dienelactone hydrolase